LATFIGRYGLPLLWLGFAPIIAIAARHPGLVPNPETAPYPWRAALLTWGLLGLESAVLFWLVRSLRRLPVAFGLALLLLVGSLVATPTDMPGYEYVPGRYHLVLVVSLGLAWATHAVSRRRNKPESGRSAVGPNP
jgi:hypothetical protein